MPSTILPIALFPQIQSLLPMPGPPKANAPLANHLDDVIGHVTGRRDHGIAPKRLRRNLGSPKTGISIDPNQPPITPPPQYTPHSKVAPKALQFTPQRGHLSPRIFLIETKFIKISSFASWFNYIFHQNLLLNQDIFFRNIRLRLKMC